MTKLKITAALLTLMLLSGCGWFAREWGKVTGYSTICVEETHVTYLQFSSGAAVLVDKDGKPVLCQ